METIYFGLGIVTALVVGLLVIGVRMVSRLRIKQLELQSTLDYVEKYNQDGRNELYREIEDIRRNISREFEHVHKRINEVKDEILRVIEDNNRDRDGHMAHLSREIENVNTEAHRHVDELNRYVDSRFDKTIDNVSKLIADVYKQSEKKDLLKD